MINTFKNGWGQNGQKKSRAKRQSNWPKLVNYLNESSFSWFGAENQLELN